MINPLDRAIAAVAPQAALKRAIARTKLTALNTGYSNHGATRSGKWALPWKAQGGSPGSDIDMNLATLRERARDLDMGGGFARGALRTMRTNIVGSGLTVRPQVDAEYLGWSDEQADAWQKNVQREFELWAESAACDADRRSNFYEMQQLAQLSWLMSGDVFALPLYIRRPGTPYDLRVRLIEADRVSTPGVLYETGMPMNLEDGGQIISGVELGPGSDVVAYHVATAHPLALELSLNPLKWVRVEAYDHDGHPNILHLAELERPGQYRGVPYLAPVMENLKQLARYTHAEQMNAVVASMFAVFIESNALGGEMGESIPNGEQVDRTDPNSIELGSGSIVSLAPGETIKQANPDRTNTAFDGFITALCMAIGSAIEIPYEILLKRFNSSYSASRAAMLEFWKVVRMRRAWLIRGFCQPLYEEWLSEAVAKGRVFAPGFFDDPMTRRAYTRAEWHGPTPGQLDPEKEVKAAELRVQGGYSTRQREAAEMNGSDWDANQSQREKEERKRASGGTTQPQPAAQTGEDASR